MRPDPGVLAAFGVRADPVPLPGGEGTAWRAGEIVLKPAGDPRVARWTADLYRDLGRLTASRDPGFCVPRPLRAATGDWATGDWATGDWATGDWATEDWAAGDWVAEDPVTGGWVAWQ